MIVALKVWFYYQLNPSTGGTDSTIILIPQFIPSTGSTDGTIRFWKAWTMNKRLSGLLKEELEKRGAFSDLGTSRLKHSVLYNVNVWHDVLNSVYPCKRRIFGSRHHQVLAQCCRMCILVQLSDALYYLGIKYGITYRQS